MIPTRQLLLLCAFIFVGCSGCHSNPENVTVYCPPSHVSEDTVVCEVLDARSDSVLIQHADLDRNRTYLEIRAGTRSSYFRAPELGPNVHILSSAQLIGLKPATVQTSEGIYPLEPISGPSF